MSSTDKIKRYFKKAELDINSDADEKIFQDVLQAQHKTIKHTPVIPVNIWRTIMKSPISKIAVFAIIIIACIIGLNIFDKTSGVVLANVLTQIERINTYMYDIDMITQGQIIGNIKANQKVLFSREYGRKMTMDINNPTRGNTTHQEEYLVPKDKVIVQILPSQKTYTRMEINDDYVERIRNESNDPGKIIEKLLSCKYNRLGITMIDGKTVEGFHTNDPNYEGGMYSSVDIKLWVDVKTQLPVQMQMDVQREGQINTKTSSFVHNFQWNVPLEASEFEPVIPDDYTQMGGSVNIPANTEETAIKGLKLFADLFGSYPTELNIVTLAPKIMTKIIDSNTPAAKKFQEDLKGLSPEERGQKNIDMLMPVLGAAKFYVLLVQDKKDPAYYGDIVKPGDADKVLMRWKNSDKDYRVIFGNLKAETVASETLIELEKTLRKE